MTSTVRGPACTLLGCTRFRFLWAPLIGAACPCCSWLRNGASAAACLHSKCPRLARPSTGLYYCASTQLRQFPAPQYSATFAQLWSLIRLELKDIPSFLYKRSYDISWKFSAQPLGSDCIPCWRGVGHLLHSSCTTISVFCLSVLPSKMCTHWPVELCKLPSQPLKIKQIFWLTVAAHVGTHPPYYPVYAEYLLFRRSWDLLRHSLLFCGLLQDVSAAPPLYFLFHAVQEGHGVV
jgi:hypothetical protein